MFHSGTCAVLLICDALCLCLCVVVVVLFSCKSLYCLAFPMTPKRALLCLFRSVAWSSVYRHMCQSPQYGCPYTFTMPEPLKLQSPGTLPVCSLWLPLSLSGTLLSLKWVTALFFWLLLSGPFHFLWWYDLTRLTRY